jgi:hypothetical protein
MRNSEELAELLCIVRHGTFACVCEMEMNCCIAASTGPGRKRSRIAEAGRLGNPEYFQGSFT